MSAPQGSLRSSQRSGHKCKTTSHSESSGHKKSSSHTPGKTTTSHSESSHKKSSSHPPGKQVKSSGTPCGESFDKNKSSAQDKPLANSTSTKQISKNNILETCYLQDITDELKTTSVDILVTNKELREISNGSYLFQADITDGICCGRLIAWGPVATFFNNKIFVGSTYRCINVSVRKTPPQYVKEGYVPFDLTLTSGATVEISSTSIKQPATKFLTLGDITKHINKRVNTYGVIIDYDRDITTTITSKGSSVPRRCLDIADYQFKVKITLWANMAESITPQVGQAVYLENALVKSYGSEVTLSCDKIYCADKDDPKVKDLVKWHTHPQVVSPLLATKRRLSYESHTSLELQDLKDLDLDTTVKVQAQIEDISYEHYNACNNCKTGVITMDEEYFCSKCTKTVDVTPRYTFTLKLASFDDEVILFHDNSPTLIDITTFQHETEANKKKMLLDYLNRAYTILLLKRMSNRMQMIQYVALDFEEAAEASK